MGGQTLKIVERNRVSDFSVTMELGGARWLCKCVGAILLLKERINVIRKFRGSSYVLLVEVRENNRGTFLSIWKIQDGHFQQIIVPSGAGGNSWKNFHERFSMVMNRNKAPNTRQMSGDHQNNFTTNTQDNVVVNEALNIDQDYSNSKLIGR
ncbi:hypothetical protein TorRG33x02_338900 [Trema orientale]|uniref:Uncharacterized protein n=1 Tax=Trema orientale TaxID=63057 RepID=A0A2P5AX35_TREOI|nr:hypothetical protein TorRG33x02_338900 [Trema orientale]